MLALAHWRDEAKCPVCGGLSDECQGSDAEWRFEAALPVRCHRMTTILRAQDGAERDYPQALLWGAQVKA